MPSIRAIEPIRDTVFIGHANPEDNEFTLWLGLQLASHGYKVWCDIVKLLGGEDFWSDIETVIRTIAAKHLYVLTRASNTKAGPLKELAVSSAVAKQAALHDFIIPLHLDDLPHGEINIELNRLNAVDFSKSWATGLAQLLKKLDEEGVAHNTNTPATVAGYWRGHHSSVNGLRAEPEPQLTNFFAVTTPASVHVHALRKGTQVNLGALPFPAIKHEGALVSFAPSNDLEIIPLSTRTFSFDDYQAGRTADFVVHPRQAPWHLTDLLRRSWERNVIGKGLRTFTLANRALAAYHEAEREAGKSIPYRDLAGKQTYRAVVGYKTLQNDQRRYYHVAISAHAKIDPPGFRILTHVLFSDDGKKIWESTKAMQRARRSQCWDWWNDDWRDKLLASVQYVGGYIVINATATLAMQTTPRIIDAPVRYDDPPKRSVQEYDEGDE